MLEVIIITSYSDVIKRLTRGYFADDFKLGRKAAEATQNVMEPWDGERTLEHTTRGWFTKSVAVIKVLMMRKAM